MSFYTNYHPENYKVYIPTSQTKELTHVLFDSSDVSIIGFYWGYAKIAFSSDISITDNTLLTLQFGINTSATYNASNTSSTIFNMSLLNHGVLTIPIMFSIDKLVSQDYKLIVWTSNKSGKIFIDDVVLRIFKLDLIWGGR